MHLIALLSVLLFVGVTQASRNDIGCFADDIYSRAMDRVWRGVAEYQQVMTNRLCTDKCRDLGYQFAATQKGFMCHCGSGYGFAMYGRRDDTRCNYDCKGNSDEKCGGIARNSVYSTGMWYNGCFENEISTGNQLSHRVEEEEEEVPGTSSGSVFGCIKTCSDLGFPFAGTAYDGSETSCYCGNSFGNNFRNIGVVGEEKCNNQCPTWKPEDRDRPGFDDKYCGGFAAGVSYISIYHTLI